MNETEMDLFHHLRSTLILLGCKIEVADLLHKPADKNVTQADVKNVMNYNMDLIGGVKSRLANLPTIKIKLSE